MSFKPVHYKNHVLSIFSDSDLAVLKLALSTARRRLKNREEKVLKSIDQWTVRVICAQIERLEQKNETDKACQSTK